MTAASGMVLRPDRSLADVAPTTWRDTSRSCIGSWLDRLAVRGMCRAFDATLMPSPAELEAIRASAAPYHAAELAADPGRFLRWPAADAVPISSTGPRRPIPGGLVT